MPVNSVLLVNLVFVGGVVATYTSDSFGRSPSRRDRREPQPDGDSLYYPEVEGCVRPLTIAHGTYQLSSSLCSVRSSGPDCQLPPGTFIPNSWNVDYSCDAGFALNTTISSSVCWGNVWTPPLQRACLVEELCPPLNINNGKVTCRLQNSEVPCAEQMKPGTIAKPRCKPRYRPAYGSEDFQLICLNNGRWNNPLFNCIPACGDSKEAVQLSPLVVNGRDAHIGLFPWHAGIYYMREEDGNVHWDQGCGGSLISDQFVLTAAHCMVDKKEENVRITLGKYYRSWEHKEPSEQRCNVSKIIIPREYSRNTYAFDIALVLLETKIKFGEFIMPVCHGFLDGSNNIQDKNLFIVGWGQTQNVQAGSASETLLYNDVTMVPPNVCRRTAPSFYSTFEKFCTAKNNSDVSIAQAGDSGGGLTVVHDGLHYIFGIVSIKFNKYSLFTNISWPFHLTWIEDEMTKYDKNFRWNEVEITKSNKTYRPYYSLKGSGKDCVVPEASTVRKFCSLGEGCQVCDIQHRACFLRSGSRVDSLRVWCTPGYQTSTGAIDGQVSVCLVDGSWSPPIPECLKTCGPLTSQSLLLRCNLGPKIVDCSKRSLPGTTARFLCAPSFLEFPDLTDSGVYNHIITCESSGRWSNETLPTCKPECGVSKEVSMLTPLIINGTEAHVGAFPWHAGIHRRLRPGLWQPVCGGSLITNRIVLTAAHCLYIVRYALNTTMEDMGVALGKYYRVWTVEENTEQKRGVVEIRQPNKTHMESFILDIALVVLSDKIKFGEFIMPVCRYVDLDRSQGIRNNNLFVIGWGETVVRSPNGNGISNISDYSDRLLYNEVSIIPSDECLRNFPKGWEPILVDKFCAIKNNTVSDGDVIQSGDSGGGATSVYNDGLHYIIGISIGLNFPVNGKNFVLFTDLKSPTHVSWMESEIKIINSKYNN